MALSDIILRKGDVVIEQISSDHYGLESQDNSFVWGKVSHVNSLCTDFKIEDTVLYNPLDVKATFKLDNIVYYMIQENKILFREVKP